MKTKTVEVELYTDKVKSLTTASGVIYRHVFYSNNEINHEKISVTYEIEEPKIEITPSRLREAIGNCIGEPLGYYNRLSLELFGELDE